MKTSSNPQFKFEKQVISVHNRLDFLPENLLMIEIAEKMKAKKIRSFKSYLKFAETNRIQRTSISIKEISDLLNISMIDADYLANKWVNNCGGSVVCYADLYTYYLPQVYEIV